MSCSYGNIDLRKYGAGARFDFLLWVGQNSSSMRLCRPVLTVFVVCAWLVSGVTGEFLRWHVESEHAAGGQHHHQYLALGSLAPMAADGHNHQIVEQQESWIAASSRSQPQIVASVSLPFQVARNTEARPRATSEPPRLRPPLHLNHFTILLI
jgi:hypothetical protein